MGILIWIVSFAIYIALIATTVVVAGRNNRSQLGFGVFALFLPVIALIVVLIMGPSQTAAPPSYS
ncbi:MAG: hypothetical protein EXQ74_05080 [Thermoleophilia bacterium]|nr:hypothetical protein [Thermoleophilia bacterium]